MKLPTLCTDERVTAGSFSGGREWRWALSLHPPPPRSTLNERCLKERENACLLIFSLANLLTPSAQERLKKYIITIQICTISQQHHRQCSHACDALRRWGRWERLRSAALLEERGRSLRLHRLYQAKLIFGLTGRVAEQWVRHDRCFWRCNCQRWDSEYSQNQSVSLLPAPVASKQLRHCRLTC